MKLINSTGIDQKRLHDLIMWCMPSGLFKSDIKTITVTNRYSSKWFSGRYRSGSKRIRLNIPAYVKLTKPQKIHGFRGYLESVVYSWEERLIDLISHELRHAWQHKKGWKVPREVKKIRKHRMGTHAKLIEVDATVYGIRKVREARRDGAPVPIVS